MEASTPSPLDRLPGRFPLREEPTGKRAPSGNIPKACRIADPFAAFPQRSYQLSRMMYARKVELMMLRAEAARLERQSAPNRALEMLQAAVRFLRGSPISTQTR